MPTRLPELDLALVVRGVKPVRSLGRFTFLLPRTTARAFQKRAGHVLGRFYF